MSAALKETGLLSRLNAGERRIRVLLGREGAEPILTTVDAALRRFDGLNLRFCHTDIWRMQRNRDVALWADPMAGLFIRAARPDLPMLRHSYTPWGQPDRLTSFGWLETPQEDALGALGGVHLKAWGTPGHGGMELCPRFLPSIPEAVRAARPDPESRWFDDVDQWGILACAFPRLFTDAEVTQGWRHLTEGHEYYAAQFARNAANTAMPEANRQWSAKAAPRCAAMAAAVREWHPHPPTGEAMRLITDLSEVAL